MLTKSGLRLGIALPQTCQGGTVDTDLVRTFALRAESLGYDDLWLTDSGLGGTGTIEPLTLLAYVASFTAHIRLGVSVIVLNYRSPAQVAKVASSLDQLSHGRLMLGVGLGNGTAAYPVFGVSRERPVARFTEGIKVLRALFEHERVSLAGDFSVLENAAMEPKPLQQPHLPIWIGGHVPAALRRAVRLGDGWMGAGSTRIDDFYAEIRQVRMLVEEQGRTKDGFMLSKRVYIAVDESEEQAQEVLAAGLRRQYRSAQRGEGRGVAGTPKQVLATLRSLRDAGLHHLLLHPYGDPLRQLETLTTEVAPEL